LLQGDVTQGANSGYELAQKIYSCFAVGAATIVFSAGKLVLDHGVAEYDGHPLINRQGLEMQAPAIEQECVTGLTKAGNKLVHDAALRSRELVLGALTNGGDAAEVQMDIKDSQQRQGGRHLYRRGGAQPGTDGDVAFHQQICAADGKVARPQDGSDPSNIVTPVASWTWNHVGHFKLAWLLEIEGIDTKFVILANTGGYIGVKTQSSRHDESIVVISMLADEIDPAGCAKQAGRLAVSRLELLDHELSCVPAMTGNSGPFHSGIAEFACWSIRILEAGLSRMENRQGVYRQLLVPRRLGFSGHPEGASLI